MTAPSTADLEPGRGAAKDDSPAPASGPAPHGPFRKSDARESGSDDGPLESLGKAISSPVEGAADDDALPDANAPGQPPSRPGK